MNFFTGPYSHTVDVLCEGAQEFDGGMTNREGAEQTYRQIVRALKAEERFRDGKERTVRLVFKGEIIAEATFLNGQELSAPVSLS